MSAMALGFADDLFDIGFDAESGGLFIVSFFTGTPLSSTTWAALRFPIQNFDYICSVS